MKMKVKMEREIMRERSQATNDMQTGFENDPNSGMTTG